MKYTIHVKNDPDNAPYLTEQFIIADGEKCFSGDVEFRATCPGPFTREATVSGASFKFTDPDHARAFARSIFMAAERLEADLAANAPAEVSA